MNIKNKKTIFFFATVFVMIILLNFGAQKTLAANPCPAPEFCKDVSYNAAKNEFIEPDGFACESRALCQNEPTYQVCCKPNTGSTATTKPGKPAGTTVPPASTNVGTNFTNPLQFTTVEGFLGGILSAIQKIIVVLALVFIVIGAVMILTSAGNSGMVENGKKAITMALVGFAIGIAAPSLLKELSILVGWGGAGAVASALTLSEIAVRVLNFLLGTMGIVALVMMVIGAIMYLTSAGDEDMIDRGKDIFKYSLIGVIMAMVSMVLVTQIAQFFR